jgi:hypothetical protein
MKKKKLGKRKDEIVSRLFYRLRNELGVWRGKDLNNPD